jgi:hypothetical protein
VKVFRSLNSPPPLDVTCFLQTTNMVISETGEGTLGYGNYLPTVLSVCHSPEWWADVGANVRVCTDISLFSSYQCKGTRVVLMGNISHAHVLGIGTVISLLQKRRCY